MKKHRMQVLADELDISVAELERELKLKTSRLDKIIQRGSKVADDIIAAVVARYPDINQHWLLTGTGHPLPLRKAAKEIATGGGFSARLQQAIAHLVSTGADAAAIIGNLGVKNNSDLLSIPADNMGFINMLASKMQDVYGISANWLRTGQGGMYNVKAAADDDAPYQKLAPLSREALQQLEAKLMQDDFDDILAMRNLLVHNSRRLTAIENKLDMILKKL